MSRKNSIAMLNAYIKAYEKKMKAEESFNEVKHEAIEYLLQNNIKLEYKKYNISILYSTSYNYSLLASEMKEALLRQKKIEELNGTAIIKSSIPYIRMSKNKD